MYFPVHGPGAKERLQAPRGGREPQATAMKLRGAGLDPRDLPPLRTHDDAKAWIELIGRAVATRRLPHNEARTAIQAVETCVVCSGFPDRRVGDSIPRRPNI